MVARIDCGSSIYQHFFNFFSFCDCLRSMTYDTLRNNRTVCRWDAAAVEFSDPDFLLESSALRIGGHALATFCECAETAIFLLPVRRVRYFYHHRSQQSRFPINELKFWQYRNTLGDFWPYFHCVCAETSRRNGNVSISGPKFVVTIVLLNVNFRLQMRF